LTDEGIRSFISSMSREPGWLPGILGGYATIDVQCSAALRSG
jgi:hypothetical protein